MPGLNVEEVCVAAGLRAEYINADGTALTVSLRGLSDTTTIAGLEWVVRHCRCYRCCRRCGGCRYRGRSLIPCSSLGALLLCGIAGRCCVASWSSAQKCKQRWKEAPLDLSRLHFSTIAEERSRDPPCVQRQRVGTPAVVRLLPLTAGAVVAAQQAPTTGGFRSAAGARTPTAHFAPTRRYWVPDGALLLHENVDYVYECADQRKMLMLIDSRPLSFCPSKITRLHVSACFLQGCTHVTHRVPPFHRFFPTLMGATACIVFTLLALAFRSVVVAVRAVLTIAVIVACTFGCAAAVFTKGVLDSSAEKVLSSQYGGIFWLMPLLVRGWLARCPRLLPAAPASAPAVRPPESRHPAGGHLPLVRASSAITPAPSPSALRRR